VIFVIRTAAPCWRSRPHRFLVMTSRGVLAAALILALTPLGHPFGFVALPVPVLLAILMIATSYLGLAEMLKPLAMRTARAGPAPIASPSSGAAEQRDEQSQARCRS
jgi:Mg2+-importing ATPase